MNIIEKLDQLDEFRSQRDSIYLQQDEATKAAFPDELRKTLDDIEVEFSGRVVVVNEKIATLEKEIRVDVLGNGATIKGTYLQAVWNKGCVSWNTEALDGYAAAHPEIEQFRKQGKPSVSIRG